MSGKSRTVVSVNKIPQRVHGHGSQRSLFFDGGSIALHIGTDALKELADVLQLWKIRLNDREFRAKRSQRAA